MDSLIAYGSLSGSVLSTVVTLYFWFVRARGERPNLRAYVIDREFFLGGSSAEKRQVGVKVGLVVANYSTLPNAILRAKLQGRTKTGAWLDVANLAFDKLTPLPFNLAPLHTVLLRLGGNFTFPYSAPLEDGNKTIGNYLREHLTEPRLVRLELHSLNDRIDVYELTLPDVATGA